MTFSTPDLSLKNNFKSTIIASPQKTLLRLFDSSENPVVVTVYDKYGHAYKGCIVSLDVKKNLLLLESDSAKSKHLIFMTPNDIVSFQLQDPDSHMFALTAQTSKKLSESIDDTQLDVEDYVELLQENLQSSRNLKLRYLMDFSSFDNKNLKGNLKNLLDCAQESIKEIAKDSFGKELLSSIEAVEIKNIANQKFSIKRRKNSIFIEFDFSKNMPERLPKLVEESFNRVL